MAMASVYSVKTPPSFDRTVDDYVKWKRKFELWQTVTDVEKKKQGGLVLLRLDEGTQDIILEKVTTDDVKEDDGIDKVIAQLDALCDRDAAVTAYEKYEHFESYVREEGRSMSDYIAEFEKRWNRTRSSGTQLSDNVLAYRLLKSANLSIQKEELIFLKKLNCPHDTAHTTHTLEERRLKVEMGILREMISRDEMQLKWVKSEEQISDVLTKKGASGEKLRDVVSRGQL